MYVDEHGDDTSTTTEPDTGNDELTVEVDGESYDVEENEDFDRDGHNDTAVVETEDGYIAFADTDGDGTADVAVEFDQDGNVVAGAEYDEASGEWVEEDVKSLPTPSGDGADEGDSGQDRDKDTDRDTERDTESGSETMTVETPNGEVDAGPAEYDTDGDGTKDTAIVTDEDGTTYAFTDTDSDGTADTAVVIEADGDVTVAENTGGDDWKVVEEGHLNPDGSYESETAPTAGKDASSDDLWADAK